MRLTDQKKLDILVKELRIKIECLKEGTYSINPDTKAILEIMGDTILLLEAKLN